MCLQWAKLASKCPGVASVSNDSLFPWPGCMGLFVSPVLESIYGLGREIGENASSRPMFSVVYTCKHCSTEQRKSAGTCKDSKHNQPVLQHAAHCEHTVRPTMQWQLFDGAWHHCSGIYSSHLIPGSRVQRDCGSVNQSSLWQKHLVIINHCL